MESSQTTIPKSELAIFAKLIRANKGDLTRPLARYLLTLAFDEEDQARIEDLAARNQQGTLSPAEQEELFNYVKAGHMLAFLHSKARKSLKKTKAS